MSESLTTPNTHRGRRRWRLAALMTAVLVAIPAVVLASHQFSDVPPTHTFHTQIGAIKDAGITGGCTATTYCPDASVTRGSMAAFMHRGFGRAAGTGSSNFRTQLAGDGAVTVSSVTISVPGLSGGSQFVHVSGQVTVWDFGNAECPCEADLLLYDVSNAAYSQFAFNWVGTTAAPGGSIPIQAVFPATPGSHTYELKLQMYSNTTDAVNVSYDILTATTFPFGSTGGSTAVTATGSAPAGNPASDASR